MPEYSSTTITPADGVKTPAMNGSTSGNYTLSALRDFILASKGQANGLASLDANGKLPSSQLPDLADDVIVVASYSTLPATGTAGKLYITADTNKGYRWDPDLATPDYVVLFENNVVFGYYSSGSFYEDSEHTIQITPEEKVLYVDVSISDIFVLEDGVLIELLASKYAKVADIQDGTITAGVATKAWQDAMGRAIITTYATKAETSDLKDALSATNKRVSNLEQKSGSIVSVDYPEYSVEGEVPAGKATYAEISKLRGVTVAYNQLASIRARVATNYTVTDNDGVMTVTCSTGTTVYASPFNATDFYNGHKYIFFGFDVGYENGNLIYQFYNTTQNWTQIKDGDIKSASTDGGGIQLAIYNGNMNKSWTPIFHDLTQMFGPSVANYIYTLETGTAGAGVALFNSLIKALDNSAETGELVSTVYSAEKSRGKNLFKESSMFPSNSMPLTAGYYTGSTSIAGFDFGFTFKPNTQYTFTYKGHVSANNVNARFHVYYTDGTGANTSIMQSTTDSEYTWTSEAGKSISYVTKDFGSSGTVYMLYLQVEEGATATAYSPYMEDTLTFPTPVTLRGLLKVINNALVVDGDEYEPESGEIERRYGIVDLGTPNWNYYGYFEAVLPVEPAMNGGTLCIRYDSTTATTVDTMPDKSIRVAGTKVYIKDSSHTSVGSASDPTSFLGSLQGVYLVYAIANPTPDTPVTPINDPMLSTEGGGTLSTTQTQDPAIVSGITMTYLTL